MRRAWARVKEWDMEGGLGRGRKELFRMVCRRRRRIAASPPAVAIECRQPIHRLQLAVSRS